MIAIVDERISDAQKRALEVRGFTLMLLPPDKALGQAVASHPDTVMFYADGEIITTADYCDSASYIFSDIRELLPYMKITFTADKRGNKYPNDCIMNALVMGKRIFAKSDTLSPAIHDFAKRHGYEVCETKQGYPACTVLALGDSAAICADKGMAKLLSEYGIRVTRISEGGILLPPHKYGFIGGAAGVYHGKVYFFGDYKTHPDADTIREAILREGYEPISLSDEPLRDLGGIIFAQ